MEQRQKQTERKKNVFNMTSGGFVIAVKDNSSNGSNRHSLETLVWMTLKSINSNTQKLSLSTCKLSRTTGPQKLTVFQNRMSK